jgi:hypothetical protein
VGWKFKVFKQTILKRLPFGRQLRLLKRRLVGFEPNQLNLNTTLSDFERIKKIYSDLGKEFSGITILELGAGWLPTIPILACAHNADRVYMADLNVHMDDTTFDAARSFLASKFPNEPLFRVGTTLKSLPLTYLAPFDINKLPNNSVDLVLSRTVLEHIPVDQMEALFVSLLPKLRKGAVMIHSIDNSDHLEHLDKTISRINFLTWSDLKHSTVNQLLHDGENRLRHHQYPPLFEKWGYKVIFEEGELHEGTEKLASQLTLVHPFSEMTPKQIATLTSVFAITPMSNS